MLKITQLHQLGGRTFEPLPDSIRRWLFPDDVAGYGRFVLDEKLCGFSTDDLFVLLPTEYIVDAVHWSFDHQHVALPHALTVLGKTTVAGREYLVFTKMYGVRLQDWLDGVTGVDAKEVARA